MPKVRAYAQYTPRSTTGQFIQSRIVPAARAGCEKSTDMVLAKAVARVPVRTGELRDSGHTVIVETEKTVTGYVVFDAEHAGYVEYGTGQRGAASPGAGPYPYSMDWQGMPAQPYVRPSMDEARDDIYETMKGEIALGLR